MLGLRGRFQFRISCRGLALGAMLEWFQGLLSVSLDCWIDPASLPLHIISEALAVVIDANHFALSKSVKVESYAQQRST